MTPSDCFLEILRFEYQVKDKRGRDECKVRSRKKRRWETVILLKSKLKRGIAGTWVMLHG